MCNAAKREKEYRVKKPIRLANINAQRNESLIFRRRKEVAALREVTPTCRRKEGMGRKGKVSKGKVKEMSTRGWKRRCLAGRSSSSPLMMSRLRGQRKAKAWEKKKRLWLMKEELMKLEEIGLDGPALVLVWERCKAEPLQLIWYSN